MRPTLTGTRGPVTGSRASGGGAAGSDPDDLLVLVTDPDDLKEELLRRALGPAWDAVDRAVREVFARARLGWPVATGRSKAALAVSLRWDDGGRTPVWRIVDNVPYAEWIRQTGRDPMKTTDRLVRNPLSAALHRATREAADEIGRS